MAKEDSYLKYRHLCGKVGEMVQAGVDPTSAMKRAGAQVDGCHTLDDLMHAKKSAYKEYESTHRKKIRANEKTLQQNKKDDIEEMRRQSKARRDEMAGQLR